MPFSAANLTYLGGIRTPHESSTDVTPLPNSYPTWGVSNDGMNMGGRPFAIDFERREFVMGTRYGRVARLQMIDPALPVGDDVNSLPIAPYVTMTMVGISGPSQMTNPPQTDQSWFEIMASLDPTNTGQGGFIPIGANQIIGTGQNYYDANGDQVRSNFVAQWPAGDPTTYDPARTPFYTMGDIQQGLIAGYFTPIPEQWRGPLRGDMLQGQASLPIITRGSAGPCASSFHVADLLAATRKAHPLTGYPPDHWVSRYAKDLEARWDEQLKGKPRNGSPVPITFLVGYPSGHWMPGHPWDNPNADDVYGMGTQITGMSILGDTLVFVGSHGYGTPCYGDGVSDPALADGVHTCYDPTSAAKANHAYPYRLQVWHYPLADLAAVAAGEKNPWDLVPEWFELTVPFIQPTHQVNGCAFDPSTNRFYLNVYSADGYGYEPGPVIYVYEFIGDDTDPVPPEPPDPEPDEEVIADVVITGVMKMRPRETKGRR